VPVAKAKPPGLQRALTGWGTLGVDLAWLALFLAPSKPAGLPGSGSGCTRERTTLLRCPD
jgi:hypothetical protein